MMWSEIYSCRASSFLWTELTQRNRRNHDHDRNSCTHARVGVVAAIVSRQPDDQRSGHDPEIVSGVTQNMQKDPHHAQVAVIMSVAVAMVMAKAVSVVMEVQRCSVFKVWMLVIMVLKSAIISHRATSWIHPHVPWKWNPRHSHSLVIFHPRLLVGIHGRGRVHVLASRIRKLNQEDNLEYGP